MHVVTCYTDAMLTLLPTLGVLGVCCTCAISANDASAHHLTEQPPDIYRHRNPVVSKLLLNLKEL